MRSNRIPHSDELASLYLVHANRNSRPPSLNRKICTHAPRVKVGDLHRQLRENHLIWVMVWKQSSDVIAGLLSKTDLIGTRDMSCATHKQQTMVPTYPSISSTLFTTAASLLVFIDDWSQRTSLLQKNPAIVDLSTVVRRNLLTVGWIPPLHCCSVSMKLFLFVSCISLNTTSDAVAQASFQY